MGSVRKICVLGRTTAMGMEIAEHIRNRYGSCALVDHNEELIQDGINKPESRKGADDLCRTIVEHSVTDVYLLSPMLTATETGVTMRAWNTGMERLLNLLEIARQEPVRIFWSYRTGAQIDPVRAGANHAALQWCSSYREKYGVDVRSLGYPRLVSWRAGTDHLSCEPVRAMFTAAASKEVYQCPLPAKANLSLMYMPDAARAAIELMEVDDVTGSEQTELSGMRVTPEQLADTIRRFCPGFTMVATSDTVFADEYSAGGPEVTETKFRKNQPPFVFRPRWDLLGMTNDMLVKMEQQLEWDGCIDRWQMNNAVF